MKAVLFVLGLLFTLTGALAIPIDENNTAQRLYVESRVTNTSDTYIINWSEDGQEHTVVNGWHGVRRVGNWSFWLKELDPHVAQVIRVVDYETLQIKIIENPDDPNPTPDLPLHACVNGTTIKRANRFEQEHGFCDGDTEYYLERIPMGVWWTLEFDEHPTYEWWLGEGQGGGANGVAFCSAMGLSIRLNVSDGANLTIGESFTMELKGQDDGDPGCSIDWHKRQRNKSGVPYTFINIPANDDGKPLDCTGVACDETSPPNNAWRTRTVTCENVGTARIRGRMQYDTLFVFNIRISSAAKTINCVPATVAVEWWKFAVGIILASVTMIFVGWFINGRK